MTNTATRLITLIMLLQRQPNQNATQLAQELNVSVRTVQRYINMLDEMGIPIYAEHGPYGGYALVRGYKMPPLVFTPAEAVALYLGASVIETVWGPLYRTSARGALAKLDNVLPDEQRQEAIWARRSLLVSGLHQIDPGLAAPHLEKLYEALHKRRRTRLLYRGRNQPEPLQREFDPYLLIHNWGWQYCLGYCHLRQDMRFFRVDRILELALLDETFEAPADFDIEAYLAGQPYFQTYVQVRLFFAPDAALIALDNRAHWDKLAEQPDGSVIVTFTTPDLERAASIILGHVAMAEVLEPQELRDLVIERARAIVRRYDGGTGDLRLETGD
ncbi:MAG: YafY family transcriptional regulator [Anaerolineales bacterium]|nr:YafY family transcriptional regulator [Anaerolineales bacterium]